ncbi:MAG: glycosyltransferase family 9 protein [Chitinophagaceae bacterium]|nr:glycosyltransferase family 9 protein [Chitinophagaceae bacterium]
MLPANQTYTNVLCVRADNMGDVIMSCPAMRALKQSHNCRITLLTSSMGAPVSPFLPEVDDTIVFDLPWIKMTGTPDANSCIELLERIRAADFDAAVIFTVYSQSPLPAATLLYMAGIPVRVAYCRENPYGLLTHWIAEKEPYSMIRHQVERDLKLVASIGARIADNSLRVDIQKSTVAGMLKKIAAIATIGEHGKYIVLHPGVSEVKREYPVERWAKVAKQLHSEVGLPLFITGIAQEKPLAEAIVQTAGAGCYSLAGLLSTAEWIALIGNAALIISVNTATVHIAAATQTPVVVLYALTNPQHTPWMVDNIVLPWSVHAGLKSKNEIICYVDELLFKKQLPLPEPSEIVVAAIKLLTYPEQMPPNVLITVNPPAFS